MGIGPIKKENVSHITARDKSRIVASLVGDIGHLEQQLQKLPNGKYSPATLLRAAITLKGKLIKAQDLKLLDGQSFFDLGNRLLKQSEYFEKKLQANGGVKIDDPEFNLQLIEASKQSSKELEERLAALTKPLSAGELSDQS